MSAAARWIVIAVAVCGIALDLAAIGGVISSPVAGVSLDSASSLAFQTVRAVAPGSSAYAAGLRATDVVRIASAADAAALASHAPGAIVHFGRPGGGAVALMLEPVPLEPRLVVVLVQGMLMALLSLVLALRAWNDPQARRMAAGFLWIAYLFPSGIPTGIVLRGALSLAADVLTAVQMMALVAFAVGWQATPPRLTTLFRRLAVAFAIVYAALYLPEDVLLLAGRAVENPAWVQIAGVASWCASVILLIVGLAVSFGHAHGPERQRLGWILVTITLSFVPWFFYEALATLQIVGRYGIWLPLISLSLPAGFAYAMLRHRLVDLGFALNRTAVFAATTVLLVGLFGALQWAADQLLVQIVGRHEFAVQMTIAVVVLYAVRALRTRTDALVSRVFFRHRQARIEAIRAIAHDVDAVSSAAAVAPFAVRGLRERARIEASIYVEDGDGYVRAAGSIGTERAAADEPAIVTLRATLAPARIDANDGLGGVMVFPLAVRGQLRGGLVCAFPAGDDEFAPDEADALAALASRAAIARDDLLAQSLRSENAALTGRLQALERENLLLERVAGLSVDGTASATAGVAAE